jgi:ribonucleoside-triphosphate reductase
MIILFCVSLKPVTVLFPVRDDGKRKKYQGVCMSQCNILMEKVLPEVTDSETVRYMQIGKDIGFERIRRITGYLVGTMDKWNDAKKAEEGDRVKHGET